MEKSLHGNCSQLSIPIAFRNIANFETLCFICRLQKKTIPRSANERQTDSSASSSIQETEDSGQDSIDSRKLSTTRIPKVKFSCDGDSSTSPSDSAGSVECVKHLNFSQLNKSYIIPIFFLIFNSRSMRDAANFDAFEHMAVLGINDCQGILKNVVDLYTTSQNTHHKTFQSPCRKYIEHVLKSRGLGQSLSFLHRLHNG